MIKNNEHSKLLKTNKNSKNMLEWKHKQTTKQCHNILKELMHEHALMLMHEYPSSPIQHVFGVISLEDWVLELRFSNLRVKFAKQEVMVSIILIISPIMGLTSCPFDCLWFPLPFSYPLGLWEPAFFNAWSLWKFGLVCPRTP